MIIILKEKDKNLSIRIYRYCIYYIRVHGFYISYPARESTSEYTYIIKSTLEKCDGIRLSDGSIISNDAFIDKMIQHARVMVSISDKDFEWLENSDRACMYMWIVIRNGFPDKEQNNRPTYESLYLSENPFSHQNRLDAIRNFYDRIEMSPSSKINSLEISKATWIRKSNEPSYFKKLDKKNEELCQWAWQYLSEKLKERAEKCGWSYINTSAGRLSPMSDHEKYLSIYGVLDTWGDSSEFKELLLLKMNKTMSQKRYRSSMVEKKIITTTLRSDTRNKLDAIATKRGIRVSEVLEWLICNEYEQQNKREK
ncbi:TPA: hypothetical protein ACGUO4_000929 [Yersinia enterocolitica]|nr:hypothetical protein [Yersinia enterocolitica]